jgi:hypothetical protein
MMARRQPGVTTPAPWRPVTSNRTHAHNPADAHLRTGKREPQDRPMKSSTTQHYKGNKQSLPSKDCVACGRPMTWRRRWARTWDQVKYCSDACRKAGTAMARP